jgi:hypothetical protein
MSVLLSIKEMNKEFVLVGFDFHGGLLGKHTEDLDQDTAARAKDLIGALVRMKPRRRDLEINQTNMRTIHDLNKQLTVSTLYGDVFIDVLDELEHFYPFHHFLRILNRTLHSIL